MNPPLSRDKTIHLVAILAGAVCYLLALGFLDLFRRGDSSIVNPASLAVLTLGLAPYLVAALLTWHGTLETKRLRQICVFGLNALPLLILGTVTALGSEPKDVGAGWGLALAWMLQWIILLAWVGTSSSIKKRNTSRSRLSTFLEELNQAALTR